MQNTKITNVGDLRNGNIAHTAVTIAWLFFVLIIDCSFRHRVHCIVHAIVNISVLGTESLLGIYIILPNDLSH